MNRCKICDLIHCTGKSTFKKFNIFNGYVAIYNKNLWEHQSELKSMYENWTMNVIFIWQPIQWNG